MKVHWEHTLCDCSPRDCLLARHHTGRLRYWQISNRGLPESHQTTLSILPASKSPKLLHSFLKSSDPISQINLAFLKKKHSKMISRHSMIELRKGQRKTMLWRQLQRWSSCCGKVILPGLFVVLHPLCKEPLIHSHPRLHLTLGWDHLGAFSSPRTWTHFS